MASGRAPDRRCEVQPLNDKTLTMLHGLGRKNDMADAIRKLKEMQPDLVEYYKVKAQLLHAAYLSFIDAGFTEAQAIELCKEIKT